MENTYQLTRENASLRISSIVEDAFVVDLHDNPYFASMRSIGVGMLMTNYTGEYIPYTWVGGIKAISDVSMSLTDAIIALMQHLSPYTFNS